MKLMPLQSSNIYISLRTNFIFKLVSIFTSVLDDDDASQPSNKEILRHFLEYAKEEKEALKHFSNAPRTWSVVQRGPEARKIEEVNSEESSSANPALSQRG
ncbi:hypothetical protein TrVE_jg7557, partial [Triparma verrucosa]